MSGNDGRKAEAGRQYVDRVVEETQRYAHELLAENDRLRLLVSSLERERAHLAERAGLLQGIERENLALQGLLVSIEREKQRLQEQLTTLREEAERRASEQSRLHEELSAIAERSLRFSRQLVQIERQNSNLANLYVASYQLHSTVDREELLGRIQEILANLVGSEQIAVFETTDDGRRLAPLCTNGVEPARFHDLVVGKGLIGGAVARGELLLANGGSDEPADVDLTACIPLKLGERVIGAIAIFRLLPQKQGLGELDRELFDLLATHAATALYCASLHRRIGSPQAAA